MKVAQEKNTFLDKIRAKIYQYELTTGKVKRVPFNLLK
jgi:hypothetical protein